jgi:hypothetical protein
MLKKAHYPENGIIESKMGSLNKRQIERIIIEEWRTMSIITIDPPELGPPHVGERIRPHCGCLLGPDKERAKAVGSPGQGLFDLIEKSVFVFGQVPGQIQVVGIVIAG